MGCAAFCGVGLWGSGSIEKSCCMALWWLSGVLGCVLRGRFVGYVGGFVVLVDTARLARFGGEGRCVGAT